LNLKGLTDVQAIYCDEGVKIIEINARLPSQTPTVVYHASGINLLECLVKMFVNGRLLSPRSSSCNAVIYAHFRVLNGHLSQIGETVMASAKNLTILKGLFGADEAITNLEHTPSNAVITVVFKDILSDRVGKRFKAFIEELTRNFGLKVKSR
jgi:pyrrolysine biosynthesis protein PylC